MSFIFVRSLGLPLGEKFSSLKIPSVFSDSSLISSFLKGLFDTDGCICFKRRYRDVPYYPVISFSSKSSAFAKEVSFHLKSFGFRPAELYDYVLQDKRVVKGFTKISKIELNGQRNFELWMKLIGFSNPKHIAKIRKYGKIAGGRFEFGDGFPQPPLPTSGL